MLNYLLLKLLVLKVLLKVLMNILLEMLLEKLVDLEMSNIEIEILKLKMMQGK